MKVTPTNLPEVLILEPRMHGDIRGFFLESWSERVFNEAVGYPVRFVQDNHSRSAKGKLVRVTAGSVFDVAVDMRTSSSRFGQWTGVELTAENRRQMWIPPGFAHGFLVLDDSTDFLYKTTDYYAPECEGSVAWNDPTIGIAWPLKPGQVPALSGKDAAAGKFEAGRSF
jgi:dTDP-4-dehydrorhamnose 3,5-epimerase